MCMLSAVVGVDAAALRLSEMTIRQEGLFGGFYTGICGLNADGFTLRKCVGPQQALADLAAIQEIAGVSGLAHSRTNGGGGASRAQPFVDAAGVLTGMGTGTHGIFSGVAFERGRQEFVDELFAAGIRFTSSEEQLKGSAVLPDGSSVHNTEIAIQGVAHYLKSGMSPLDAIALTIRRMPAEGAYVFLFRHEPERLYVANFNMRLTYSRSAHALHLASSKWALPPGESNAEVAVNSLVVLAASGPLSVELDAEHASRIDHTVPEGIDNAFVDYVRAHPGCSWSEVIERALLPLFPRACANLLLPEGFRAVERLCEQGVLIMSTRFVSGALRDMKVPQTALRAAGSEAAR